MLLDESPDALVEELGNDGMQIWWPERPEPYCYNGHHIQEIIDLFLARRKALISIEKMPASGTSSKDARAIYNEHYAETRFRSNIFGRCAILIGNIRGIKHAVAWYREMIYDPNGRIYKLDDGIFTTYEAYIILDVSSEMN